MEFSLVMKTSGVSIYLWALPVVSELDGVVVAVGGWGGGHSAGVSLGSLKVPSKDLLSL